MEERELYSYVRKLWRGAKKPSRQLGVIAELTARTPEEILNILKKIGEIPRDVSFKNYREKLKEPAQRAISDEWKHYIVGSVKRPQELAKELRIPQEEVNRIRRRAEKEAKERGRAVKKRQKKGDRHAVYAAGDRKRAGTVDRSGGPGAKQGEEG